jgi:hypothetical protein
LTLILGGILALALASQFVALARFRTAIENKAEPAREAYVLLNHMTHVLRFAKTTPLPVFTSNGTEERLTATIEGGHIGTIPSNTACYYRRVKSTNRFYFKNGTATEEKISEYITYFNAVVDVPGETTLYDPILPAPGTYTATTPGDIMLQLIFSKGDTVTPIQTTIQVMGE